MEQLWEDWLNLLLGIVVLLSPAFLAISPSGAAAWNAYVTGGLITLVALFGLSSPQRWEEWVNLILGLWLIVFPFGLGIAASNAGITLIVIGVLVGAFAIWALVDLEYRTRSTA